LEGQRGGCRGGVGGVGVGWGLWEECGAGFLVGWEGGEEGGLEGGTWKLG